MAIENVVYQKKGDFNSNEMRIISTIAKGHSNEFEVDEVRLLYIKKTGKIGGHYRDYPEVWGFVGNGRLTLEDIETKERRQYEIEDGSRIFIPANVASSLEAVEGMCVVTCAPKGNREKQTHKYEII